jgi:hypothetical protein
LQLLDCLLFFKTIPNISPDQACQRFIAIIRDMDSKQLLATKNLVLKSNLSSKALLGAIIENTCPNEDVSVLFKALNHQSTY